VQEVATSLIIAWFRQPYVVLGGIGFSAMAGAVLSGRITKLQVKYQPEVPWRTHEAAVVDWV